MHETALTTVKPWLSAMAPALPDREYRALRLVLGCCFPYQLAWIFDFGGASILVKSRQIGGSWAYALWAAILCLFGENVYVVSVGEREAAKFLGMVEGHCRWLAGLGSHWALPLRRTYCVDLVLRTMSGGSCTALPASSAGRGMSGSVILDEFAYHVDAEKVWDAAAAATLHRGKLRILSTPNGPGGLFFDLVESPDDGTYRRHCVTLEDARAQGLVLPDRKIQQITRGSPQLHAQLFGCKFVARGGAIFRDLHRYRSLPASYRIGIGLDFSYSLAQSADYCVAVVVAESGGRYYVLDVIRRVTQDFSPELRVLKAAYPGVRFHWYCGPSERLFGNQLLVSGVPLMMHEIPRGQDKYARALPTAGLWNTGMLQVPEQASWLSDYVAEMSTFTGAKKNNTGLHDDQVDATVSAVDALRDGMGTTVDHTPQIIPSAFGRVPQHISPAGAYSPGANLPQLIR